MTTTQNISTEKMSHTDWLKARKLGIGSSDVGAILGLNPYRTQYDVYLEKTADEVAEMPLNAAMEFGLKLEQVIADTYAERNNRKVIRDDQIRVHPEYPFMLANLDRLIVPQNGEGEGILELKTASGHAVKHWDTEVPLGYFSQLQHQFFVSGLNWGAFALLVDGRDYSDIPMKRDDAYIKTQNEMLFKFWNENVLAKVPPTPTVADLSKLKPTATEIEATDEIVELCSELADVKERLKTVKASAEEIEEKLKEFIGLNEMAVHKGIVLYTWKHQHRNAEKEPRKAYDFRDFRLKKQ